MKVRILVNDGDEYGMYGSYIISSPNNRLSFSDGEPEDNNLNRNFNDVYSIESLIQEAFQAGKNGERLVFETIKEVK